MRYAIYFTSPERHPLTQEASRWLGRDAFTGEEHEQEPVDGFPPDKLVALTADPRRYGFHATLKAPFELAAGRSEADLHEVFERFCAETAPVTIPEAVVGQLGPFFAIVPSAVHQPLQDFAARVVEYFEPLRAPLSEADIARRNPEKLTERRRANLMRWGYPGVMDDFRFHMTLTGPVEEADVPAMRAVLEQRFSAFHHKPLRLDGLAIFVEPQRGAPFTVNTWLPLKGA